MHQGRNCHGLLTECLQRAGLSVVEAVDGASIESGTTFVAPADRHLVVANGHVRVLRSPREGLHRPSINVTFRSAAMTYGPRVIGVLFSGSLDDCASGLWEIVKRGGIAIVQSRVEAEFSSMPLSAIEAVPVSYELPGLKWEQW